MKATASVSSNGICSVTGKAHHWLIDTPHGATSDAHCIDCKTTTVFYNSEGIGFKNKFIYYTDQEMIRAKANWQRIDNLTYLPMPKLWDY